MIKKVLDFLEKNSEFTIVGMILVVLGMLIIPLPTGLLDFLIAINICLSIIVLMVVIYMNSPLNLTSFPSILLVLALFRIGITISTTRLILLNADAGEIVQTFGEFVAGGNLVVGGIVFIIITIINFIVITKGSERVAEVSARFTLDAMPGKQMSIDSDLRANSITMEEATVRRKNLELESRLFGAMDGAMKFVKGDSIASIIDIVINIIGGVIVGVVMHSMAVTQALSTYSILTIGDGLVQQIPSLIVSVTAGMMITRVSDVSETKKGNLGKLIVEEITGYPKAFLAASVILFLMAWVPGMPRTLFLILFVILVGVAITMIVMKNKKSSGGSSSESSANQSPKVLDGKDANNQDGLPMLDTWKLYPLLLELSSNLKNTPYLLKLKDSISSVQKNIILDLGVETPQIFIRFNDSLAPNTYQVLIHEVPSSKGVIRKDQILILDTEKNLGLYGVKHYEPNVISIGTYLPGFWINQSYISMCKEFNLPYLTVEEYLLKHMSFVIKKHVSIFLGMQEVKNNLDKLREYQDLIKELLRMIPLNKITDIFQRLVAEDISIRNFKVILDALLEWAQKEKDPVILTEYARIALGRYIAFKFAEGKSILPVILISPDLEDVFRDSIRNSPQGNYLSMDPEVTAKVIYNIKEILAKAKHLTSRPALLVSLDIRRYVRSAVERDLPFLSVLSFQELEGHIEFESLGVIEE